MTHTVPTRRESRATETVQRIVFHWPASGQNMTVR